jgi:hypothetical protein
LENPALAVCKANAARPARLETGANRGRKAQLAKPAPKVYRANPALKARRVKPAPLDSPAPPESQARKVNRANPDSQAPSDSQAPLVLPGQQDHRGLKVRRAIRVTQEGRAARKVNAAKEAQPVLSARRDFAAWLARLGRAARRGYQVRQRQ